MFFLIPFKITSEIKYLGINLAYVVKDIFAENYKTLIKEIEDGSKKWKHISYYLFRKINIAKLAIKLKAIYKFIAFLSN